MGYFHVLHADSNNRLVTLLYFRGLATPLQSLYVTQIGMTKNRLPPKAPSWLPPHIPKNRIVCIQNHFKLMYKEMKQNELSWLLSSIGNVLPASGKDVMKNDTERTTFWKVIELYQVVTVLKYVSKFVYFRLTCNLILTFQLFWYEFV